MSNDPNPPPPAEPLPSTTPPVAKEGTVVGGCLAFFVLCAVMGYATAALGKFAPYNLAVPLVAVLCLAINLARRGWNRTHTGLLIGLLLTIGFCLLLMSICGH
jgi:hypothetical protein